MLDARIDYPCGSNGNGRGPENRNGDDDDDDEGTCEGTSQLRTKLKSFNYFLIHSCRVQMMSQK